MARERYLINAGEDTIHSNEIKLVTAKDKRENWWYYHKRQIIPAILVVALLAVFIHSMATKVDPDYTIGLLTSFTMPETGVQQLEECIAAYADDRNGDGKVVIQVSNYVMSDDASANPSAQEAAWVRFTADASLNATMIYLHDSTAFSVLEGDFTGFFQYKDGTLMPEDATDYENAMYSWDDIAAFANLQPVGSEDGLYTPEMISELFSRLRVSVRAAEGSSIEKKEKDMDYYNDSMALFERMKNDEPITGDTTAKEG